jgi:hypothetical protein
MVNEQQLGLFANRKVSISSKTKGKEAHGKREDQDHRF